MNIGDTIYIKKGGAEFISRATYWGETSRSWLIVTSRRHEKCPKNTTVFVTEADFNDQLWANRNRGPISRIVVSHFTNAEQLRKIAEIVGYTEEGAA
jgi:hypothetical protein